jgi:hypothetical protein
MHSPLSRMDCFFSIITYCSGFPELAILDPMLPAVACSYCTNGWCRQLWFLSLGLDQRQSLRYREWLFLPRAETHLVVFYYIDSPPCPPLGRVTLAMSPRTGLLAGWRCARSAERIRNIGCTLTQLNVVARYVGVPKSRTVDATSDPCKHLRYLDLFSVADTCVIIRSVLLSFPVDLESLPFTIAPAFRLAASITM